MWSLCSAIISVWLFILMWGNLRYDCRNWTLFWTSWFILLLRWNILFLWQRVAPQVSQRVCGRDHHTGFVTLCRRRMIMLYIDYSWICVFTGELFLADFEGFLVMGWAGSWALGSPSTVSQFYAPMFLVFFNLLDIKLFLFLISLAWPVWP